LRTGRDERRETGYDFSSWYRKLVARKFDGSNARRKLGRAQVDDDIER
jgi:hypothetical protein